MLSRDRLIGACLCLAVVIATYAGWRLLSFSVDDAYIAFRYASNSLAGHGLTWNPPPFRPVEGYTSFLWVTILREVWRVFGVEPPTSANYLSLAFGYATLFIGYRFIARMHLPPALSSKRWALVALVMLGTVTNRTFLTWLSSGLETSLFNFLFTWWIYVGTTPAEARSPSWAVRLSSITALVALTRPDGLLLVAATPLMLLAARADAIVRSADRRQRAGELLGALRDGAPLIVVAAHLVWRKLTYGDWLPNTYYAKHVAPWPESGVRYAASFVVEYGVWVWMLLVVGAIAFVPWRKIASRERVPQTIAIAVVLAHAGYYTLVVGGDHFEYRVYSHLVLLLFVSSVWSSSFIIRHWTGRRAFATSFVFVAVSSFIASSYPIPWVHWALTQDRQTRAQSFRLTQPLAPSFPRWSRPIVASWDDWQAWLISHAVCVRHQEHKVFVQFEKGWLPKRGESGLELEGQGQAVVADQVVGVLGWVLPDVAVIDLLGLNDRVIARNPERPATRQMAHDRKAPDGYLACFRPNVAAIPGVYLYAKPRAEPLTDADIVECETKDWY